MLKGEFKNLGNSLTFRDKQTAEQFKKSNIKFRGRDRNDPTWFFNRYYSYKWSYGLNLYEINEALTPGLDIDARNWFDREYHQWPSFGDLINAFSLQFGSKILQVELKLDIDRRTLCPYESISVPFSPNRRLSSTPSPIAVAPTLRRNSREVLELLVTLAPSSRKWKRRSILSAISEFQSSFDWNSKSKKGVIC